ncbi:MAG: Ig-like domain-containing protein [Phycisphaeraceae bacterium]|nr:MAG: Ig-like domain-containing protein [Phycisphaeraceae bacterium]
MTTRYRCAHALIAGLAVGLGGVGVGEVHAQTRTWRLPQNGLFTTATNWVSNTPPAAHETAEFGLTSSGSPFTVTFNANATLGGLRVVNQRPTLDFGGRTLNLNGDLIVRGVTTPHLTLLNGSVLRNGTSTHVGNENGWGGRLVVGAGALLETRSLFAGDNGGTGTVIVENGGVITGQNDMYIGRGAGSTGSLTVRGAGSAVNTWNLFTSQNAQGTILIEDGGVLTTISSPSVSWTNSRLDWTVRGAGSRVEIGGTYSAGDSQRWSVRVEDGGVWENQNWLETSTNPLSESSLVIDGLGSEFLVPAGGLTFRGGTNDLSITNGGRAELFHGFRMGCCNFPGQHTALVRGVGSELVVGDWPNPSAVLHVGVDHTGSAEMIVDQGATLRIEDSSYIGHRGPGRLIVDGPGSLVTSPHTMHVGWHDANSNGELIARDGAVVSVGHYWMKGGSGSVVSATITDGALLSSTPHGISVHEGATLTLSHGGAAETTGGIGIGTSTTRHAEMIIGEGSYAFASGRIDLGYSAPDNLGTLTMMGGTAYSNDYMPILYGGLLRGVGFVETGVSIGGGTMSPGLPVGELFVRNIGVNPDALGRPGVIAIDLGGTTPGVTHDKVTIEQRLQINRGVLALSTVGGYTPQVGQTFDVITASQGVTGQFEGVTGTDAGPGTAYVVQYLPDRVRVVVDGVTGLDIAQPSLQVYTGFIGSLIANAQYVMTPPQNVNTSAAWTSDNPAVAMVDAAGKVRGVSPGSTVIRATYAGQTDSVPVTVSALPVPPGVEPGLDVEYRRFWWPDHDMLTPIHQETRPTISIPSNANWDMYGSLTVGGANVAGLMEGVIEIPVAGTYEFTSVDSCGEARLMINGQIVAFQNDPEWFLTEWTGAIELPAGPALIRYEYAKRGNYCGYWHTVLWKVPGSNQSVEVPASAFGEAGVQMKYYLPPDPFIPATMGEYNRFDYPVYENSVLDVIDYNWNPEVGFTARYWRDSGTHLNGWLVAPESGTYTIYGQSLGYLSVLRVNGQDLGSPGNWFAGGTAFSVQLQAGLNQFEIDGFMPSWAFDRGYRVWIEGPGIERQVIPASAFWRGTPEPTCPADFNGDDFVDFFDLDAYVACFEGFECPEGKDADFNGDGFVDFFDLDEFTAAFEAGC